MEIPLYLAMTPKEYHNFHRTVDYPAWMNIHFNSQDRTLCNLPIDLSKTSLLIIDDSVDFINPDIDKIIKMLLPICKSDSLCGIILDFQKPSTNDAATLASRIQQDFPGKVACTSEYLEGSSILFLPSPSPIVSCRDALSEIKGKRIWLDCDTSAYSFRCSGDGITADCNQINRTPFLSEKLHCHYWHCIKENMLLINASRTVNDWMDFLSEANRYGVEAGIMLHQEWKRKTVPDNRDGN